MATLTPVRKQYLEIKKRYPDSILLFRYGDFYEAFDDDAHTVARELEITLTSRELGKGQKVPMAGIPHHALEHYLSKLVKKGYSVAICEQLSPPGKGLVERDVVRVVTPGTVIEPGMLEGKAPNYLAAVVAEGEQVGLAYADITTGEFAATQLPEEAVLRELERLQPAEVLKPREDPLNLPMPTTAVEFYDSETSERLLLHHLQATTLEGLGLSRMPLAIRAAAAIISYVERTQKGAVRLSRLTTYSPSDFMVLDATTCRHLEIFQSLRSGQTLFSVLDATQTPMGGRLLRKWLSQPLLDIEEIERRLDSIEFLVKQPFIRARVIALLKEMPDLERLLRRIQSKLASPREVITLGRGLARIPELKQLLAPAPEQLSRDLKPCPEVVDLIFRAVSENEGVIKPGFSPELDELKTASRKAKDYLANLERQERERTGIKSLKVGYNQVFGYYIEVTKPNLHLVPPHYIRKQTLAGAERFITPELKECESLILHAKERIEELEGIIFRQVCEQIAAEESRILDTARTLAYIDVAAALAEVAVRFGYTRPRLTRDNYIRIKGGRHPVVERTLPDGFVPNDTFLSGDEAQLIILTGPNMSGKSTYLRQVALIVLMAQAGCFVPAEEATIGIVDRIFTRVGLADDISAGQSTFMVEMIETANILHNATQRSLIILDEIGRGTSTYDGISIARAVAEYIHNHPRLRAKTLFATHYHELADLAKYLPRVQNYKMAVLEEEGRITFLRKVVPGSADKSYGIHVAQLAGLPPAVVNRAREILRELENGGKGRRRARAVPQGQLSLLGQRSAVLEELLRMDPDSLSPLEALTLLYELKKKAEEEKGLYVQQDLDRQPR